MMSDGDYMERNAAAARFLSLPKDDQYKWVQGVIYLGHLSEERKRYQRYLLNKKIKNYEQISYLNEQELINVGGLGREEAESLYNRSQKKPYKCPSLLGRLEQKKFKEMMMGLTVEDDEELIYPQSDDDGASSEANSNQTDEGACSIRKINCYDDQGKKELVEMVKSYQMKLEELNQIANKRKSNLRN
uniref:uncharacterized protein LOC122598183 n=1 Tax=Erigeron canadensis TaxID=72917 RepID=UPI001CB94668|nr:uncharacterized protein LOC122598183 [Erigeron canadensis]